MKNHYCLVSKNVGNYKKSIFILFWQYIWFILKLKNIVLAQNVSILSRNKTSVYDRKNFHSHVTSTHNTNVRSRREGQKMPAVGLAKLSLSATTEVREVTFHILFQCSSSQINLKKHLKLSVVDLIHLWGCSRKIMMNSSQCVTQSFHRGTKGITRDAIGLSQWWIVGIVRHWVLVTLTNKLNIFGSNCSKSERV